MADIGFRSRNPATGFIQIDSTYKNWTLRSKTTFTLSDFSGYDYQGSILVNASANACIAWRSDQTAALVFKVGNQLTFRSFGGSTTPPATITVYVFDEPAFGLSTGGNFGLRVRNAAGGVTFDSRLKYMRRLDELSGPNEPASPITRTYGSNYVPAVIQGNLCYYAGYEPVGVGTVVPYMEIFKILGARMSGSSVTWTLVGYGGHQTFDPPNVPPGQQLAYSYTIIDVAGF